MKDVKWFFYLYTHMKKLLLAFLAIGPIAFAQHENPNPGYWQQHVDYKMDVKMDVEKFQYSGTQDLVYTNNSNDTLKKVFYHFLGVFG